MQKSEAVLFLAGFGAISATLAFIIADFLGYPAHTNLVLSSTLLFSPALIFVHACVRLTTPNALCFLVASLLYGYIIEQLGLQFGAFGGAYEYDARFPTINNVPYLVPLYWFVFLYLGFALFNSPLRGAFAVLAIDISSDPLHVFVGNWRWLAPGGYFGVPLGNFVGWLVFSYIFLVLAKAVLKSNNLPSSNFEQKLPFFFYNALAVLFLWAGFRLGIPLFTLPGVTLMAYISYTHWREQRAKRIIT